MWKATEPKVLKIKKNDEIQLMQEPCKGQGILATPLCAFDLNL